MMTAIIVDDEYLAIRILKDYASLLDTLIIKKTFNNPLEVIPYIKSNPVDLIFVDIQMPYLNGIELFEKLDYKPLVIFTTARQEFAVQAFDLDVVDYLVKPITFERFKKAVNRAGKVLPLKKSGLEKVDYLMIKSNYKMKKIFFENVIFVEGLKDYVKIHSAEKFYVTLATLKDMCERFPKDQFVRIHKSYIISLRTVQSYNSSHVTLTNRIILPIGRVYKNNFLRWIGDID